MQFFNSHFRCKRLPPSGKLRTKQQNCHCITESLEMQSHEHKWKLFLRIPIEEKVENLQVISPTVCFIWWRFSTALQFSVSNFHPKYLLRPNRIIGSFLLKESKNHQTSPGNSLDLHHHPVLSIMIKIRLLQNQRDTSFTGWISWLFSNHRSLQN